MKRGPLHCGKHPNWFNSHAVIWWNVRGGGIRLIVLYVKSWQVICAFRCPFWHKLQNNDMVVFKLFKHISRPSNQSGIFFLAAAFLHLPVLHSLFFSLSAFHPEPQMIFPGFIVSQREKWDRCALTQYTYGWTQVTDWSDLFINAANSSWEITWSVWTVVLKIGESQKYLTQKIFTQTSGVKGLQSYHWAEGNVHLPMKKG